MLNSILSIINTMLMYSAPLIFGAMGGVISESSGVVNVGIEGMMTFGAFVGAAVGFKTQNPWRRLLLRPTKLFLEWRLTLLARGCQCFFADFYLTIKQLQTEFQINYQKYLILSTLRWL